MSLSGEVWCALYLIWTFFVKSAAECTDHEDNDVDLDKDFLQDLREVKTLTERENLDEHRQ